MAARDKQILERAIAEGLLTKDQATALARLRHRRKERDGMAPPVEKLAVEQNLLTAEQAQKLADHYEGFSEKRTIAGYRLLEKIGSGSMGTVYKAVQLSLDRVVAIKMLSPHLGRNTDYVERFLREARAVARLNHPNVISGIDVGEADGFRYFVMEYASGLSVQKILDRGGSLDPKRVSRIAAQIARALQHAHEAGLVHRDVKPDNILVTKDGVAKLCDLGLAKDRPEGETRSLGTPNYISPEQAEGITEVDIRSDLYSLGATLFHMLTGEVLFSGTAQMVMARHLTEPPRKPSALDPEIPVEWDVIVGKLLEKKPAARYQTPEDLGHALETLGDERKVARAEPKAPARSSGPAPARRRRRRR